MQKRISIPLRLAALPAAAALTVLLIAGLSLVDLERTREDAADDEDTLQVLKLSRKEGLLPRTRDVPRLSEAEALKALRDGHGPGGLRPAVERLWPEERHRGHLMDLMDLLLSGDTPEEVRLLLLGRFQAHAGGDALEAARSIAREKDLPHGPLSLSVYEILARHGDEDDLFLLHERPGEPHQLKTQREEYRDVLHERVHGE